MTYVILSIILLYPDYNAGFPAVVAAAISISEASAPATAPKIVATNTLATIANNQ